MKDRTLIIDANNLLYRTFFAQFRETDDILMGMCYHSALRTLQKYYKLYPATELVAAFDSISWRTLYTRDLSRCVTHKKYKGQRRQGLTDSQKEKFKKLDEHIDLFAEFLATETSVLVLRAKYLEADDLIAGYIDQTPDMQHVLITSDKDYMQLLGSDNLIIIDPESGKPRSLVDWNNDPGLFLFEKCLRGDTSDNIMSAYPRLRTKKILEAYADPYAMEAVMNNKFKMLVNMPNGGIEECEYLTRDVFNENNYLMNLRSQPEYIKQLIKTSIAAARESRGKFNYVKFIKFCHTHDLKHILKSVDSFVPMLSSKSISPVLDNSGIGGR